MINSGYDANRLVFEIEEPAMPDIKVWEYRKIGGQPVDIEAMLSRIWDGQGYETLYLDDGGVYCYRLPPYESRHGRFREEVHVADSGFSYMWEINENFPKRKDFEGKQAAERAYDDAIAFLDVMFGGDGAFWEFGSSRGELRDEDNNAVNHMFIYEFEHRLGEIPVFDEGLTISAIPEGVFRLSLRWSRFEPLDAVRQQPIYGFDWALHAVRCLQSHVTDQSCGTLADDCVVSSARAVYAAAFSEDECIYRPAWQLDVARADKLSFPSAYLVDMRTGDIFNEHDGLYGF
jgi:hypothetical protein